MELLCNLDEEERDNLRSAMFKMEADKEKKLYESKYTYSRRLSFALYCLILKQ